MDAAAVAGGGWRRLAAAGGGWRRLAAAGGGWRRRGKAVTAAAAGGVLSLDELVESDGTGAGRAYYRKSRGIALG